MADATQTERTRRYRERLSADAKRVPALEARIAKLEAALAAVAKPAVKCAAEADHIMQLKAHSDTSIAVIGGVEYRFYYCQSHDGSPSVSRVTPADNYDLTRKAETAIRKRLTAAWRELGPAERASVGDDYYGGPRSTADLKWSEEKQAFYTEPYPAYRAARASKPTAKRRKA